MKKLLIPVFLLSLEFLTPGVASAGIGDKLLSGIGDKLLSTAEDAIVGDAHSTSENVDGGCYMREWGIVKSATRLDAMCQPGSTPPIRYLSSGYCWYHNSSGDKDGLLYYDIRDCSSAGPSTPVASDSTQVDDCDRLNQAKNQAISQNVGSIIPPNPNKFFGSGSCIDSVMKQKIKIIFSGFGGGILDTVMDSMINMAADEACNMADKAIGSALNQASSELGGMSIPLPGGGSVNAGAVATGIFSNAVNGNAPTAGQVLTSVANNTHPSPAASPSSGSGGIISNGINAIKGLFN